MPATVVALVVVVVEERVVVVVEMARSVRWSVGVRRWGRVEDSMVIGGVVGVWGEIRVCTGWTGRIRDFCAGWGP